MLLHINGEQREFPDSLTVAALVVQLGMKPDRVAVELNLEIIPRTQWETTTLKGGDKLEVVHFVGGGSTSLSGKEAFVPSRKKDWTCPACGSMATAKFCSDCGEKKFSPADLSFRHFFSHALGEFFHFDSKIFRSFALLFTKPGFLTAEYLRGCRKPYLHPFQLFFVANLIYFVVQPFTGVSGLRATLNIQVEMMPYRNFASRLVAHRLAVEGVSFEQFSRSFDHIVDVQARSLVLVMVLIYALGLALLQWRKKQFFGQHLVFCLHFTAFWMLAIFIGLSSGASIVLTLLASSGAHFPRVNWDRYIFAFGLLFMLFYAFRALQVVYHDSVIFSLGKAFVLVAAFLYVLDTYRFILFLTALYAA
jgi:thiamine biosynthesis protein ThiS